MDNLAIFLDKQKEAYPSKSFDKDNQRLVVDLRKQYEKAMQEMHLRLALLAYSFQETQNYQPIYSIQYRLKSTDSILNKLAAKDTLITMDNIRSEILDIVGFRIVCHYQQDIYRLSEQFLLQEDVRLIKLRDYIEYPKENGYRSLHLVISIPLGDRRFPIEIQFRTVAMDMWASIEHNLCYKTDKTPSYDTRALLKDCASELAKIDGEITDISKLSATKQENNLLDLYNQEKKEMASFIITNQAGCNKDILERISNSAAN